MLAISLVLRLGGRRHCHPCVRRACVRRACVRRACVRRACVRRACVRRACVRRAFEAVRLGTRSSPAALSHLKLFAHGLDRGRVPRHVVSLRAQSKPKG